MYWERLLDALMDARSQFPDGSLEHDELSGLINSVLDDWAREDREFNYPLRSPDEAEYPLRGTVFVSPDDAADYLDDIPVGGQIIDLGDGFYSVAVPESTP